MACRDDDDAAPQPQAKQTHAMITTKTQVTRKVAAKQIHMHAFSLHILKRLTGLEWLESSERSLVSQRGVGGPRDQIYCRLRRDEEACTLAEAWERLGRPVLSKVKLKARTFDLL